MMGMENHTTATSATDVVTSQNKRLKISSSTEQDYGNNVAVNVAVATTTQKNHQIFVDDDCLFNALEFLDVVTLIKKKTVCKAWQQYCTEVIDMKCRNSNKQDHHQATKQRKAFQSNKELRQIVDKYYGSHHWSKNKVVNTPCTPTIAEDIASKYGYPIGKWDVSSVEDFSKIFQYKQSFNEPIGSWDVSNATSMHRLFMNVISFNQDISSWDVSNVTNMRSMLYGALAFNHDISGWDVSSVRDMSFMFFWAESFDQDILTWDVTNVKDFYRMFKLASTFDKDLSSWNVSSVSTFHGMFNKSGLHYKAKRLPWFKDEMLDDY